jgi:hypothetical protein
MSTVSLSGSVGLTGSYTVRKSIDPTSHLKGHRQVTARVEIDFPSGVETFTGDGIISLSLLEEANITGKSPLGFVSSNEFALTLNNSSRRFTPKDLSDHTFYRSVFGMFDQNPSTVCKVVDTDQWYIEYGVPYWSGQTYEEFLEYAVPAKKIVIKSNHNETITFSDYFYIYIWGNWWSFYKDFSPITFEPYEAKEFEIIGYDYSGGIEPELYSGFYIYATIDWYEKFDFSIQEIELWDNDSNNLTTTPTSTLYNSGEYYAYSDPEEFYEDQNEPKIVRPGLEIRPYLTVTDGLGTTGEIPLGKFWCGEWDTPTNSLEAKTVAYDRLMNIITLDTPQIPVMTNTTIGQMFARLFRALEFEWNEYIISPALNQHVRVGWFPRDKVGQSLQLLAEAGNCYVSVNRDNQIVVMPNLKSGESIKTYTDKDNIFVINNPQRILDIYTAVKVVYRLPYLKDPDDALLRVDKIFIPANSTTVLDRIDFKADDIPIMQINWVYIYGNYNVPETQFLDLDGATGGTFALDDGSNNWTVGIAFDASAETIKAELEALYGEGNVEVKGRNGEFTITFTLNIQDSGLIANFSTLVGAELPSLRITQPYKPPMKSKVIDISYGATDITLTIQNDGDEDEEINIQVKGIGTGYHDSHRVAKDQGLIDQYGHKELPQENPLVQDRLLAEEYSQLILSFVSDPMVNFEVSFRGDPSLEVGQIITIENEADEIEAVQIVPRRISLSYDRGNLKSNMSGRKVK